MGFFCFNILHFQVCAWVHPQYETTKGPLCEKACAFYKFETSFVVLLARLVKVLKPNKTQSILNIPMRRIVQFLHVIAQMLTTPLTGHAHEDN